MRLRTAIPIAFCRSGEPEVTVSASWVGWRDGADYEFRR